MRGKGGERGKGEEKIKRRVGGGGKRDKAG